MGDILKVGLMEDPCLQKYKQISLEVGSCSESSPQISSLFSLAQIISLALHFHWCVSVRTSSTL